MPWSTVKNKALIKDETGKKYGRLTAIGLNHVNKRGKAMWLCRCECGKETVVEGGNLRRFHTVSCGCFIGESTTHRNRQRLREKNFGWRGGARQTKEGYIIKMATGHPRADKDGYVFEHILVAEKVLGEYIPKGHVIHHINCIRNDNRIENLWWFPSNAEHMKHHAFMRTKKASGDEGPGVLRGRND